MIIEIKNRFTNTVLISGDYVNVAEALQRNLKNTDLRWADLRDANLRWADLRDAESIYHFFRVCPEKGSFVAWKKIANHLIELKVPASAKRVNALSSRKIRVSKAKVIKIFNMKTNELVNNVIGGYDSKFVYDTGKMVFPDKFNNSLLESCTNGIHCFISRQEAVEYN